MALEKTEKVAEIIADYFSAVESASVSAKRQIAELFGISEKKKSMAVNEATFSLLKFEPQVGAKLGDYEIAYKQNNKAEKFQSAFEVLSNATIQNRYHGQGYLNSYWVYGEGKIYRQKLKEKTS